jgi:hypothetical protein
MRYMVLVYEVKGKGERQKVEDIILTYDLRLTTSAFYLLPFTLYLLLLVLFQPLFHFIDLLLLRSDDISGDGS